MAGIAGIAQAIARSADREALFVKQVADAAYQQYLVMLVITTIAAPLDGFELCKLLFPVTQDMRLDAAQFADLADCEIAFGGDWRQDDGGFARARSEEHTSELQSLMRISYAVFCLKKKKQKTQKYIVEMKLQQQDK